VRRAWLPSFMGSGCPRLWRWGATDEEVSAPALAECKLVRLRIEDPWRPLAKFGDAAAISETQCGVISQVHEIRR
jgi:hypothetical protein